MSCSTEEIRGLTSFELADRLVYVWCRNDERLKKHAGITSRLKTTQKHDIDLEFCDLYDSKVEIEADMRRDEELAAALIQEWQRRHSGVPELTAAPGGGSS